MGQIPTTPAIIPVPFAANGQKNSIPETVDTPGAPNASWSAGFPSITMINKQAGGKPPLGMDFNGVLNQLSNNAFFAQSGGLYPWDAALDYLTNAHVQGSDGEEYIAVVPSGPDVPAAGSGYVGAQDPTADTANAYWISASAKYGAPIATTARAGLVKPDGTTITVDAAGKISAVPYELCEFYFFRHPTLRPGFVQAAGGLIANAAALYPKAFAYLQTTAGQLLCKTEAEWQAMSTAIYYTDAEGNQEGWNGVGGVPWFVIDTNAGTIRVPDIRGMHAEAAGLDSLVVGGVHADRVREVNTTSNVRGDASVSFAPNYGSGAIWGEAVEYGHSMAPGADASWNLVHVKFDLSRSIPTGSHTAPRAFGTLACVYLGV